MTYIIKFNEIKNYYEKFKQNLPQDTFSRLYEELKIVRGLISAAKLEGLKVDTFEYQQIAEKNLKQLHEMGYKKLV